MQIDQCREAFEAHYCPDASAEERARVFRLWPDGRYFNGYTQARYEGWQAARSAPAAPVELPERWREQFSRAVYTDLAAADNQDVPLEEYPNRILKVLDSIVGPRHPAVMQWRNDAIRACIEIVKRYGGGASAYQERDMAALYTVPAPVELPDPIGVVRVFEPHEGAGKICSEASTDITRLPIGRSLLYTEQQVRELLAAARRGCEAAENLPETRMDTGADRGRRVLPEWLPIESVLKDKTILLGYRNTHGNWQTLRGEWFSREEIDEFWEDPDGVEPGWFETSVEADDVPNVWRTEPTHWMPLRQPPKES